MCPWHNWLLGWSPNPSLWPQNTFSQDWRPSIILYTTHTIGNTHWSTAYKQFIYTSDTTHTYTYTCIYIPRSHYRHYVQRGTVYTNNIHTTHIPYRQCLQGDKSFWFNWCRRAWQSSLVTADSVAPVKTTVPASERQKCLIFIYRTCIYHLTSRYNPSATKILYVAIYTWRFIVSLHDCEPFMKRPCFTQFFITLTLP